MSRSNPNARLENPSTRWFEWHGQKGIVTFYNKAEKKNIDVPLPFTFIVLDEMATVRGWQDSSSSGIYSNEVRDTAKSIMSVKSFKGGQIAQGLYKEIKDKVFAQGGYFAANVYIAYKNEAGVLELGALQLAGAALNSWIEFRNIAKKGIYEKAIQITGNADGKKGAITFKTPIFQMKDVDPATNDKAVLLDKSLQVYLEAYLSQMPVAEQVQSTAQATPVVQQEQPEKQEEPQPMTVNQFTQPDDLPF